jgi:hypothetical protein
MWYAMIYVCLMGTPMCDDTNAAYAEQSPPLFDSMDECLQGAYQHMLNRDPPASLKRDTQYDISITCEQVETPSE